MEHPMDGSAEPELFWERNFSRTAKARGAGEEDLSRLRFCFLHKKT
jgi:hypothetical protein